MFNKGIDRLFQEKFKDFEEKPNPKIWKGIDKQLAATNTKRLLRYRLVGIAAVLLFVFGIWKVVNSDSKMMLINDGIDFVKENKINSNQIESNSVKTIDNAKELLEQVVLTNEKKNIQTESAKDAKKSSVTKQISIQNNSEILSINKTQFNDDVAVSEKKSITKYQNNVVHNDVNKTLISNNENTTVINDNTKVTSFKNSKSKVYGLFNFLRPYRIEYPKNELILVDLSNVKVNMPPKNSDIKIKEKLYKRWEIGSVVAPIYYASISKGSPLDENISNSEKSNSNSFAYGVNVAYKLNKKWSLKTGLFQRNLSYTTNNVGLIFQVITQNNTQEMAHINWEEGEVSLHAMNDIVSTQDVTFTGNVTQDFHYLELPLEFRYNLLDKRIGINLNGGFSTLFLNKNKITFEREYGNFSLGKASNLNDTSYSLNIGFESDIKISENWKYSIAPSFKYHLNPFSEGDGGFRPYSLGLNTGFHYNF